MRTTMHHGNGIKVNHGTMETGLKLLVIEQNNTLREKIAGMLSRLDAVEAVCQIRDLNSLDQVLNDFHAHVVLLDMAQALEHEDVVRNSLNRSRTHLVIMTDDTTARYEASGAAARINAAQAVQKSRIASEIDGILACATTRLRGAGSTQHTES